MEGHTRSLYALSVFFTSYKTPNKSKRYVHYNNCLNKQLKLVYHQAGCQSHENDHVKIRRATFDTCHVTCKGCRR